MIELRPPDHRTPPRACPYCGRMNDCLDQTAGHGGPPEAGDVTLCIGCGGLAVFESDLTCRKPTDPELFALCLSPLWTGVERTRRAIMIAIHRRKDD